MINKDNDGRDNTAKDTTPARDSTTGPNKAVVKDLPIAPANSTPGYSAGNPDAKETPADKIAPYSTHTADSAPAVVKPVIAPEVTAERVAAKVASERKFDDRAHELDLARRQLDGSGDGIRMGHDTHHHFASHSLTNLTTLEEIDRQSAILNKERQDKRVVEQDKQANRTDKQVADDEKRLAADDKDASKRPGYSGETFGTRSGLTTPSLASKDSNKDKG